MPNVFVDTGAWIALMVPRDKQHARATETFRNLPPKTRLITTDYVVAETVTWLVYHNQRQAAFRLRDMLAAAQQQQLLTTEWISPSHYDLAWMMLEKYDDHEISFCDCTSFVISGYRNVDFVFGFDEHFRTAGYDLHPGP